MLNRSEIAAVFSSRNVKSVANGEFAMVEKIAKNYQEHFGDQFTVGNVFDFCYKILKEEFRNEYFYKNTIARKVFNSRRAAVSGTLFTEFRVGGSKADCVVVNDVASCYEIKTDYDNLAKLKSQLEAYLGIFDKVNAVVSAKYIDAVSSTVPAAVGIILLTEKDALRVIRPATLIQDSLDTNLLMRSLRRDEYVSLANAVAGYSPSPRNTEIFGECRSLIECADPGKVRKEFRRVIKRTRALDKSFISSLPSSLMIAGVESSLTRSERIRLVQNVDSILCRNGYVFSDTQREAV